MRPRARSQDLARPVLREAPVLPGLEPMQAQPAAVSTATAAAAASLPSPAARSSSALDLRPTTAAQNFERALMANPANGVCGLRAQPRDAERCPDRVARADPGERLQRSLGAAAGFRPALERRPPPELHHQIDDSYRYEGPVFRARIAKDGTVSFTDQPNFSASLLPYMNGQFVLGIGGRFDINDAIDSAQGAELYPAEKRWFLEQTADLRRELATRARSEALATGARQLRGEIEHILDDASLSPAQKRARVFALWDSCSPDDTGSLGQQVIEDFVRERMPRGSELGYGEQELAVLNRNRASHRRFDPYARADVRPGRG